MRIVDLLVLKAKPYLEKNPLIDIVLGCGLKTAFYIYKITDYLGILMESTLVTQGLDLMLYGMGTVFAFLTLLVGITTLMSSVVNKLVVETELAPAAPVLTSTPQAVEPRIAKVIQAAIDQHRK